MRILLIDDNVRSAILTKKTLVQNQHLVDVCSDASRWWHYVKVFQPHLIFLNMVMPGITGPEIAEALRKYTEFKHVPLIFFTESAKSNEKSFHEEGFTINGVKYPILSKPYSNEELLHLVKKHEKHQA